MKKNVEKSGNNWTNIEKSEKQMEIKSGKQSGKKKRWKPKNYINILIPILIATKITNKDVIKASVLLDKNFIFKKLPICPPINTVIKRGQYFKNSYKTISLVNCPATPKMELININRDAVLVICFG